MLLLRRRLALLLLRSRWALLRLRSSLMLLLLLRYRLALLLLLRDNLTLWLLLRHFLTLWLDRCGLPPFLLRWNGRTLLRHNLPWLLLLRRCLALRLHRSCLPQLWLRRFLTRLLLTRLRHFLAHLMLRYFLTLLLGLRYLRRLPFLHFLVAHLQRRWSPDVAIRRQRLTDCCVSRTSMVDVGKLSTIGARSLLILYLGFHRRGVRCAHRRPFRGLGPHLDAT